MTPGRCFVLTARTAPTNSAAMPHAHRVGKIVAHISLLTSNTAMPHVAGGCACMQICFSHIPIIISNLRLSTAELSKMHAVHTLLCGLWCARRCICTLVSAPMPCRLRGYMHLTICSLSGGKGWKQCVMGTVITGRSGFRDNFQTQLSKAMVGAISSVGTKRGECHRDR